MTPALFVYGTLRPNHSAWGIISPYVEGEPIDGHVHYMSMFEPTHGRFPMVVDSANIDDIVHGNIVALRDIERLLPMLDRYEAVDVGLYRRVVINAHDSKGGIHRSYLYVINEVKDDGRHIVDGIWNEGVKV